jgi:hypothetical protein
MTSKKHKVEENASFKTGISHTQAFLFDAGDGTRILHTLSYTTSSQLN